MANPGRSNMHGSETEGLGGKPPISGSSGFDLSKCSATALSHFHMPPTLGLHRQLRKLPRTHTRPHLQSEGSRLNITITIHLVTCDNHSAKSESYQEDARHTDRTASEGEIDG
jgi:hypothetical protein